MTSNTQFSGSENPARLQRFKNPDGFVSSPTHHCFKTPSRPSAFQCGSNTKTPAPGISARRALGDVSNTAKKRRQQQASKSATSDMKIPPRERLPSIATPKVSLEIKSLEADPKTEELTAVSGAKCEEPENGPDIEYMPPSWSLPDDYSDVWPLEERHDFIATFKKFVSFGPDVVNWENNRTWELDLKPLKVPFKTIADLDLDLEDAYEVNTNMSDELISIDVDDL